MGGFCENNFMVAAVLFLILILLVLGFDN